MEAPEDYLRAQLDHSRDLFRHRPWFRVRPFHMSTDLPLTLVDVDAGTGLLGDWPARRRPRLRYDLVEPIDYPRRSLASRHGAATDESAQLHELSRIDRSLFHAAGLPSPRERPWPPVGITPFTVSERKSE